MLHCRVEQGHHHECGFVGIYDDRGAKPWVCFNGTKPDEWETPVNLSFAGKPFHITDVRR